MCFTWKGVLSSLTGLISFSRDHPGLFSDVPPGLGFPVRFDSLSDGVAGETGDVVEVELAHRVESDAQCRGDLFC